MKWHKKKCSKAKHRSNFFLDNDTEKLCFGSMAFMGHNKLLNIKLSNNYRLDIFKFNEMSEEVFLSFFNLKQLMLLSQDNDDTKHHI